MYDDLITRFDDAILYNRRETFQDLKSELFAILVDPNVDISTKKELLSRNVTMQYIPYLMEYTIEYLVELAKESYWMIFDDTQDLMYNFVTIHYLLRDDDRTSADQLDKIETYCQRIVPVLSYHEKSSLVDALKPGSSLRDTLMEQLMQPLLDTQMECACRGECLHKLARGGVRQYAVETFHEDKRQAIPEPIRERQTVRRRARQDTSSSKVKPTIYLDRQNVHNDGIVDRAKNIVAKLPDITIEYERYKCQVLKISNQQFVREAFDMFETDASGRNLPNIFCNVWAKILESQHYDELVKRLLEEFKEMRGLCSTGHLTRLLNILSSYSEAISIEIDFESEIYAAIIARFQTRINDHRKSDDIVAGLGTQGNAIVEKFVSRVRPKIYAELLEEYLPLFSENFTREKFDNEFNGSFLKILGYTPKIVPTRRINPLRKIVQFFKRDQ
jgi:hypothetical protein